MIPALLALSAAVLARSLVGARLDRWNVAAPALMVLCGAAAALSASEETLVELFNTEVAQHAAEIVLAVLLFADATEVRGGRLWGSAPGLVARVLLLALPLSLGAAVLLGAVLLPGLPWPMLLLLACVVIPSDFAAAERVVRDPNLPTRVRSVLNVESGYNDGLMSPVFLFALILSGSRARDTTALEALATAVPFALKALVVGGALGSVVAVLLFAAVRAGWSSEQGGRVAVLVLPLLAYTATSAVDGNGFVASFVCGIAFRHVLRGLAFKHVRRSADRTPERFHALTGDLRSLEDATGLLTMVMWFVVGGAGVVVLSFGVSWQVLLYCLAALTALRVLPVVLSLLGTDLSARERFLVGALGPRGTTSIVFGLLAFNGLPLGDAADTVLTTTVVCVLGSVLLHGFGSAPLARRLTGRGPDAQGRK